MLDRNLYKVNDDSTSVSLSLGNRTEVEVSNPNSPNYYRTSTFPQPAVIGIGYVTSAGAAGSFLLPSSWSVVRNSTGYYTITHKLPVSKYLPMATIQGTANQNITVNPTDNTTDIRTYNAQTGSLVDSPFMFVFYLIS